MIAKLLAASLNPVLALMEPGDPERSGGRSIMISHKIQGKMLPKELTKRKQLQESRLYHRRQNRRAMNQVLVKGASMQKYK